MSQTYVPRRVYTPPADSGAHHCPLCDVQYATDFNPDVIHHELSHRRLETYTSKFGPLMTRAEQRAADDAAARVLQRTSSSLDERVAAATSVLRAHHHRHMRMMVKGAHVEAYCTEKEFIAAADLERIFAADVAVELRKKYGRISRPEIAMKDWNYPP